MTTTGNRDAAGKQLLGAAAEMIAAAHFALADGPTCVNIAKNWRQDLAAWDIDLQISQLP